jgi:phage protein D
MKECVTKHWHVCETHMKLGDILANIAGKHGLKANIDAKYMNMQLDHIDQTEESDFHFMSRLAERYDAVGKVSNGVLVFSEQGTAHAADGRPMPTITIKRGMGDSHHHVRKGRLEYGGVKAFWWDKDEAQRKSYTAGGGGGKIKMLKGEFPTCAEATDAANAEFKRLSRDASTIELSLANGKPECCAEQFVILEGFRPEMNTTWVSTEVTHTMSASGGFSTRIQLEKP